MIYQDYAPIYEAIGQGDFAKSLTARILAHLPQPPRRVLDLACGTGAASLAFARAGARVVGVDRSAEMLDIARAKSRDSGLALRFLQADLRYLPIRRSGLRRAGAPRFGLQPASFDLITCLYDSLNYLTEPGDLALVCAKVSRLLRAKGRFIFDLNTEYEFATWDESDQVVYDSPDILVYNRLDYDPDLRLATGRIVWFVREIDRWWRGEETHTERAWSEAELVVALESHGLRLLARHTPTWEPAPAEAMRVVYEVVKA